LVSINIPTLNSSATLGYCLKAIRKQTYKKIQIIVVDSYSSDNTVEIAEKYDAEVFFANGLLNQRQIGIRRSKGEYIFLVDSDQILDRTATEQCVAIEESLLKPEAIILNEVSVPMARGSIAKSQAQYVRLIHAGDWDPLFGTALPRFFPAKVLKEIPPAAHEIGYFDHAFLYKHATERGVNARFAPEAVIRHYEVNTTMRMLRKFYKYYGFYVIPALLEDGQLVFARVLPRRTILSGTGGSVNILPQVFLYGAKGLATSAGTISCVISDIFNTARDTVNRLRISKSGKVA
jgi:glycosyltransferase involved in cell wall biosynthesis